MPVKSGSPTSEEVFDVPGRVPHEGSSAPRGCFLQGERGACFGESFEVDAGAVQRQGLVADLEHGQKERLPQILHQ